MEFVTTNFKIFTECLSICSCKFYIKRNNSKVNSIETGPTVIADLFLGSDQ